MRALLLAALLCGAGVAFAQANPLARGRLVSAMDCLDTGRFVTQYDDAPANAWMMRVQHIGDAGTIEQAREVANPVTWNMGQVTGLVAPASAQRGYRDEGPPVAASAFQVACEDAGFLINTFQFRHALPLSGEGPSVGVLRSFSPGVGFGRGIVMSADVRVPYIVNQRRPVSDGTAQLSFLYYLHDRKSGLPLAHLVGIFENRRLGDAGYEAFGDDGFTAFASSPLRETDASGAPVQFVAPPTAEAMHFASTWGDLRHFQAVVTEGNLRRLLAKLRESRPAFSPDPADYEITVYGLFAEVFPGTGNDDNVAIGGSFRNLRIESFESPWRRAPGR